MTVSNRLTALAHDFRSLKDRKETLEAELKQVNKDLVQLTTVDLVQAMDDAEIEKFSVDGVGSVYQQVMINAYVKVEDHERFYDWLRVTERGDLIKETVHPQTLKAFAREVLESGEELPDYISASKVPTAVLRRK